MTNQAGISNPPRIEEQRIANTVLGADPPKEPTREPRVLAVKAAGMSDTGKVREANEDQFVIETFTGSLWVEQSSFPQARVQCGGPRAHLFVVADGVGGNPGGQRASALAVQAVQGFLIGALGWLQGLTGEGDILQELKAALRRADDTVQSAMVGHPDLTAMATTLTLACSVDDLLYVAHAGDSRCYLHRGGRLHQLTHDDTIVGALVEAGVMDSKTAASHGLRHLVTNVVGGGERGVKVEVHKLGLVSGDAILLCTDGLTEMLSDEQIASILTSEPDPTRATNRLIGAANDAGGRDNVTAVVARYE